MMFCRAEQRWKAVALCLSAYIYFCSYQVSVFPFSHTRDFQPEWYQNAFFIWSGIILCLPAHLFSMLLGKLFSELLTNPDMSISQPVSTMLSLVSNIAYVVWGIVTYFLFMKWFRWIERRRNLLKSNSESRHQ